MATGDGPIARGARSEIPYTFDALVRATTFGAPSLDLKRDYVVFSLFGTTIPESLEATTFDALRIAYAGKALALEMVPAGIDFWAGRPITKSATGTNESKTYESRVAALKAAGERLAAELAALAARIEVDLPVQVAAPSITPQNDYVTPDPFTFPPAWAPCPPVHPPWVIH